MTLLDQGAGFLNLAAKLVGGRIDTDIAYGTHDRQRLDIYHARTRRAKAPVLVFFYGGAWVKGSRGMYAFVGRSLARSGITVIIPDYRLRHHAQDAAIEDGASALAWVNSNVSTQVCLAGHSAGAHIAASLAYESSASTQYINGFVGMAGPYDYLTSSGTTTSSLVPALLMVAGKDRLIPSSVAERFAERLHRAGAAARIQNYPRASHATLIGAVSPLLRLVGTVRTDIVNFAVRDAQTTTIT